MRSDTPRPLAALALAAALLGTSTGCASAPMSLEEMHAKTLRTPYDTLEYFLTAVRYREYDAIWDLLSPETQRELEKSVPRVLFATFFPTLKVKDLYGDRKAPEPYAEMYVIDVIHRAEIISVEPDEDHPSTIYWVQFLYRDGPKPLPPGDTRYRLMRVPGDGKGKSAQWTIDLMRR